MDSESQSTISTYATIWLTLISGAILFKAAHDYWALAIRATRKRNIPEHVSALLDKMPVWTNYFAFVPIIAVIVVVVAIGFKILSASGLDTLVRVQVGLAMGVILGRLGVTIGNKADDRLQSFKPIYLVPVTVVGGIMAFGVYVMLVKCPERLAEQWVDAMLSLTLAQE